MAAMAAPAVRTASVVMALVVLPGISVRAGPVIATCMPGAPTCMPTGAPTTTCCSGGGASSEMVS